MAALCLNVDKAHPMAYNMARDCWLWSAGFPLLICSLKESRLPLGGFFHFIYRRNERMSTTKVAKAIISDKAS